MWLTLINGVFSLEKRTKNHVCSDLRMDLSLCYWPLVSDEFTGLKICFCMKDEESNKNSPDWSMIGFLNDAVHAEY